MEPSIYEFGNKSIWMTLPSKHENDMIYFRSIFCTSDSWQNEAKQYADKIVGKCLSGLIRTRNSSIWGHIYRSAT